MLTRLVVKWLNAGVMNGRQLTYPDKGTPQGGVISPLLANIYLDEVVDKWWVETILTRLNGRGQLVRYADDMVMLFERKADAERMMVALPRRFGRYGLELHPEKTRMVYFESPAKEAATPQLPLVQRKCFQEKRIWFTVSLWCVRMDRLMRRDG